MGNTNTGGLDLTNAVVVGFFSLPSPSMAEHNPSAYNAGMAAAPNGAGSCQHCGTGILHHVIIRSNGQTAFIGRDCANRVGSPMVRRCVREQLTAEQIADREAAHIARFEKRKAEEAAIIARVAAERAARYEVVKDIVDPLRAQQTDFHSSLADQLLDGSLSDRQAAYVCKAMFGRYSKRVAEQWDAIYERCVTI